MATFDDSEMYTDPLYVEGLVKCQEHCREPISNESREEIYANFRNSWYWKDHQNKRRIQQILVLQLRTAHLRCSGGPSCWQEAQGCEPPVVVPKRPGEAFEPSVISHKVTAVQDKNSDASFHKTLVASRKAPAGTAVQRPAKKQKSTQL
ncbi:uncharacterized protein LOC125039604 isoform X3 [Penaeus chinensis]|uniref:uncharacterized protein LOC125039604 isoform X3 n=1 Tax=Penaeus chinensis TaxID=139456 RepID=UPI001FB8350D|nr:uncharacterized protein LOC125039604 isoform X3 [Penaeus chinensis]